MVRIEAHHLQVHLLGLGIVPLGEEGLGGAEVLALGEDRLPLGQGPVGPLAQGGTFAHRGGHGVRGVGHVQRSRVLLGGEIDLPQGKGVVRRHRHRVLRGLVVEGQGGRRGRLVESHRARIHHGGGGGLGSVRGGDRLGVELGRELAEVPGHLLATGVGRALGLEEDAGGDGRAPLHALGDGHDARHEIEGGERHPEQAGADLLGGVREVRLVPGHLQVLDVVERGLGVQPLRGVEVGELAEHGQLLGNETLDPLAQGDGVAVQPALDVGVEGLLVAVDGVVLAVHAEKQIPEHHEVVRIHLPRVGDRGVGLDGLRVGPLLDQLLCLALEIDDVVQGDGSLSRMRATWRPRSRGAFSGSKLGRSPPRGPRTSLYRPRPGKRYPEMRTNRAERTPPRPGETGRGGGS